MFNETKCFRFSSKEHAVCVFAELHLPSAPPTPETPESEVDENGSTDADTTAEDGEVNENEEEENLVPVGGGDDDGRLHSVDGRHDQQQNGWPSSTKRPPQTVQGGGVRHHEGKQRPGGKGSGVRFRATGWPLILAAALVSAGAR